MFARLTCFLRRQHDYHLRGSSGRVFLECERCGHQSPGWEMGPSTVRPLPVTPSVPRTSLRLLLDERLAISPVSRAMSHGRALRHADELRLWLD